MYGNGVASEGPEDFGASTWAMQAERAWEKVPALTVEQAEWLRHTQRAEGQRRLVEHLATHPEVVRLLRWFLALRAFTKPQKRRVTSLLYEAGEARKKLLEENSALAAHLRSKARVA